MWGPLVLAGDLGPEPPRGAGRGLNADGSALAEERRLCYRPVLVSAERPVTEWVKPVAGSPGKFRSEGVGRDLSAAPMLAPSTAELGRDVEFMPFYRLHRRMYAGLLGPVHAAGVRRRKPGN